MKKQWNNEAVVGKLLNNNILKSSFGLLSITLIVKVFGYVEKLVLAKYFGTSYQVDVYTLVLTIILSLFYFFREVVEPGFLNIFLDAKSKGKDEVSWNLFNKGLRLILPVTIVISLMSLFFPGIFIKIFAPGFDGKEITLAGQSIRIAVPSCVFLALSTLTSITLNGLKMFVLPASGELVFKGVIIGFMVLLYNEYGIVGATIGIVAGSAGRLMLHMVKLYKRVNFKKITIESEYKKKLWLLTWPLLFGVGFSQVSGLVDNIFASYLQEGAIAALSYAKKVVELPVVIFPYVISIVIFPYFSQLAIEKQAEKLKTLLSQALKWITIAFLPVAMFFIFYATPIIEVIFERGAFDANSTALTSRPLLIYSFGMIFFAIETILVIFYYANADTKTPIFVGIACVILNILLTWVFVNTIGYIGIALAYVIQKAIKNMILLYLVKFKVEFRKKDTMVFLSKVLGSSLIFGLLVFVGKIFFYEEFSSGLIMKASFIAVSFTFSAIVYLFLLSRIGLLNTNMEQ